MSNNLSAFEAQTWSKSLVKNIDQINVMKNLVNTDYEGDLVQSKTVKVRTLGSISLSTYTQNATISYQDLAPATQDFTVGVSKFFAFQVDDVERAQNDINALDGYTRRAAVAINNEIESQILIPSRLALPANQVSAANAGTGATATATVSGGVVTAFTVTAAGSAYDNPPYVQLSGGGGFGAVGLAVLSGGTVASITVVAAGSGYTSAPTVVLTGGDPITLDSSTTATGSTRGVYEVIGSLATVLSNANVPETGRWLVVNPSVRQLLWNDTAHFIRATELGDSIVMSGRIAENGQAATARTAPGFIGQALGFDIYMVTHLPTAVNAAGKLMVAGTRDAISYAAQIVSLEALRLQTTFADAVRGLILHDSTAFAESSKCLATALCTGI